jgi:hypothetical protein
MAIEPLSTLPKGSPPQLITAVENAIYDVFDHHGADAFEASREATIFHEVGHAIVGSHEGFKIRQITISSQAMPIFGEVWGGRCEEAAATWTSGPDTSADDDLRRARFIVAGLAGEAVMQKDKPGSSLDELAWSQMVGVNAAAKLADPTLSDAEYNAYVQRLWHEQVWGVTINILYKNREPFLQLANHLLQHKMINGNKLRKLLRQIRKIAT